MTTVDVMAKLEHAYKIKLDDLSQDTSMGSYESEVPKVLMKEVKGSQNIIKGDESHFTISRLGMHGTWLMMAFALK